jgi:N-sulfoglucosamine sulfohydrolase
MGTRRQFLAAAAAMGPAAGGKPNNIVYLHSHDTGRWIQPYGAPVPTPNLARLAAEGVLFRNAFSAAPTCSPSRAALLTGQSPHASGMTGLAHRGFSLNDYRQHMLHTFRQGAGYRSALIGVQHVARSAEAIGYDRVVPTASSRAVHVAPRAVEYLTNEAPRNQPFYLEIGFQETHRTFPPPGPREDPRFTAPPVTVPDTPRTRLDMASFKASARLLDDAYGQVLDALERSGLAGNTLVICTTDHGIAFPDMKCHLTDHGIGVLLILRGPGGFSGGKVSDAMVSHLDLFPTLCDVAGVDKPRWLEGSSLMPLVRGTSEQIREELFAEVSYHAAYEPKRAVRTRRWKYIRNFGGRTRPVLPNCDDGPSKTEWLEAGWASRPVQPDELYDLVFDPQERRNLAADPAFRRPLDEMRARLEAWMKRTGDPLLAGPVKAPAGARVNDPDGVSPQEPVRNAIPQ